MPPSPRFKPIRKSLHLCFALTVLVGFVLISACGFPGKNILHNYKAPPHGTAEIIKAKQEGKKFPTAQAYKHFLQGKKYELLLKHQYALDEYELALIYERDSAQLYYDTARMLIFLDRFDEAEKKLTKACILSKGWPHPFYVLGELYFQTNRIKAALAVFSRAILADPQFAPAYRRKAEIMYLSKGQPAMTKVFEEMTQALPEAVEAWIFLAQTYRRNQQYDKLEKAMEQLLRLAPDNMQILNELADWYEKTHKYKQAIKRFSRILKNFPNNKQLHLKLGRLHLLNKDKENAAKSFWNAQNYETGNLHNTQMEIGLLYLETEHYPDAATMFSSILEKSNDTGARYWMAYSLLKQDKYSQAKQEYEKIPPNAKDYYFDAQADIALSYIRKGNPEKAEELIDGLLAKYPEEERIYRLAASRMEEQKQNAKAENILKQGIKRLPRNISLRYNLGLLLTTMGKQEEALDIMYEILAIDHSHAEALNYIGFVYADQGRRLDEAEKLIRQAMRYKPEEGYIIDSLGWVYYKRGQYKQAIHWLKLAVLMEPLDPEIMMHLALSYRAAGQKQEMLNILEQIAPLAIEEKRVLEKLREYFPTLWPELRKKHGLK